MASKAHEPHEPHQCAAEPAVNCSPMEHGEGLGNDSCGKDSQYHEVSSTTVVPIKSGREDKMVFDSDRPGSAGTSHSVEIDEEDEQMLANLAPSKTDAQSSPTPSAANAQVFARSDHISEPGDPQGFMFGKPLQKKLDFQGTRASHAPRTLSPPTNSEGRSALPSTGDNNDTHSIMPATHETQHDGEDVTKASTARNRSHGELDDRGSTSLNGAANRPQRPRSTPSSPSGETAGFNTPNITTITEDDVTPREPSEANSIEQCDQQGGEEAVSISREESRSPPLDQQPAEGCRSEHHALPRGQQLKDLRSSEPAPTTTRSALADSRCETNAQPSGSGAPSPKQTRASQATREQRNKRSNILHAQVVPAGVSKRPKQKKAQHGNKNIVTTSEPDPSVYLEIFLYKQRERTQNAVRKAYEERDIALQQQQELMATNAALGQELDSAYEEKQGLQLAHQAREVEMRKLKEISSKHKKFIDGLSNDLNSVKAKFGEKQEKAVEANRSLQDEREGLLRTLNECAERASQQRNVALEACSETQIQLQAAILRADYLDQQLSEKVGLLAEERDRRAQLERRMLSASDSSDADRALIKKGQDALLDKLFLIDATLESNSADSQTSQLLSQVLEAVQTISTQTKTSADDATVTKGLVEALGDRLAEVDDHASSQPLKKHLDDVLAGLQKLADSQEDGARRDSAHRNAMNGLQEKLTVSNAHVATVEQELMETKDREGLLLQEIENLKNSIEAVHSQPSSGEETHTQLEDTRAELQAKVTAFEQANASLASKASELEALRKTNEDLRTSIQSLRTKIDEQELTMRDLIPQKEAIEDRTRQEIERVRAESLQHHEEFRAQLEMEKKNQLKKLTSDRDRYEKQVIPLKDALNASKRRVEELQQSAAQGEVSNEQLDQMKKLSHTQSKEIEALKSSLSLLQESANLDASLKAKLADIASELDTERALRQEADEAKAAFLQQSDEHLKKSAEAKTTCEQAKAELATCRTSFETEIQKLAVEVQDAQEARQRAEAGQEHLKRSCDATLENESNKNRHKEEALQESLAERDTELRKVKDEAVSFQAEVEREYELMRADHVKQMDDLRHQIQKLEAARNEAVAKEEQSNKEREILLEQIDALKKRLESTEEAMTSKASRTSNPDGSLPPEALRTTTGITPSAGFKSMEPSRPRKKVDRNYNSTIDTSALPVPEVLRPVSQGAGDLTLNPASREPFASLSQVEETQFTDLDADELLKSGTGNFNMFSEDDNVPQANELSSSHQPTEWVEETQMDSLPSFAEFNRAISTSQAFEPNLASPSLSMSYRNSQEGRTLDAMPRVIQDSQRSSLLQHAAPAAGHQTFSIYEDSHEVNDQGAEQSRNHSSSGNVNGTVELSQQEREKYTFRKKMPQPNSASKIVRADSQSSVNNLPGFSQRAPLGEQRFKTPEVRGEGVASRGSTAHSSSPAYVQPTSSRPARTYSTTPAGTKPFGTQSSATQDPRLAGRNLPPAQKRKTSAQIVEGYEPERKKRHNAASAAAMSDAPRSLRSHSQQSQQSIRDVPSFSSLAANSQGSGSQSRLRTLGGGGSRASGSRKVTRAAEYGARFSQELR